MRSLAKSCDQNKSRNTEARKVNIPLRIKPSPSGDPWGRQGGFKWGPILRPRARKGLGQLNLASQTHLRSLAKVWDSQKDLALDRVQPLARPRAQMARLPANARI